MRVLLLVLALLGVVVLGNVETNGLVLVSNDTGDYRGVYFLKVFDLQRWWDLGYSEVLVRASVGAEWRFQRVNGSVLDFALFWEDCSWCDSGEPPPVKNVGTLYEDEILRVTYVGGRWVVEVLWHQGGFGHKVYVNGSLFFTHYGGSSGGGPVGEFPGAVLRLDLRSLGDSRADSYAVFFSPYARLCSGVLARLGWAAAVGLEVGEVNALLEGVSVRRIDRGDGFVRFVLSNGSVVSVPVFFEVQSSGTGLFVVGNPSCVNVTYVAVLRFSKGGVRGELRFNLTVPPLDAVVFAPAVFRGGEEVSEVSLFLYAPAGTYTLGNFSVSFDRPRFVAGNQSVLLRPLHAVFLPPEVRRLVDAVSWCNSAFWRAFDEVADPYDYSLLGDAALAAMPVGKIAGFFGRWIVRGGKWLDDVGGLASAVKSVVYALSSSKWARAAGAVSGYVLPDLFIAEDLRRLLDPAAAGEVFSAFGVDLSEAPDGLALAQWGGWKIIFAEVENTAAAAVGTYREKLTNLERAGILAGGSFTPYGVALAAFRVDALRGATAGGNALGSGPVDNEVLAYPQAKSGLVEWARLLDKRHEVAPLLAVYEGEGPEYRVKAVLFERLVDLNDREVSSVWERCLGGR